MTFFSCATQSTQWAFHLTIRMEVLSHIQMTIFNSEIHSNCRTGFITFSCNHFTTLKRSFAAASSIALALQPSDRFSCNHGTTGKCPFLAASFIARSVSLRVYSHEATESLQNDRWQLHFPSLRSCSLKVGVDEATKPHPDDHLQRHYP